MKRIFSRLLLASAIGVASAASLAPARAAGTTVSFGLSSWIGFAPLFVASAKHFFGDYPIRFVHMDSGINAALISGAIDTADISMNEAINDRVKGFPVKIVMPIDYSAGADAIVAKDTIRSVADLRGKTVPLDTASYSELLLSHALHGAKLSLADVKQTDMPASDIPAALLGGHAAAGVTWAPNISMITAHKGFHVLYTSADAPGLITDNFAARTSFLKAHPGAMPAIIKGFLEGSAYIRTHPAASYRIIGKALGISPADAKSQYAGVVNPSLRQMKAMMTGAGGETIIPYKQNIAMVRALMISQKQLAPSQTIAWASLLDPAYVSAMK
ncbi:MAG TPA: ABC transporter substrate-binding protein [Acidiphilium sp.]|nr:ABC transporter substrate-binding protein [Acidiphilium sp.]